MAITTTTSMRSIALLLVFTCVLFIGQLSARPTTIHHFDEALVDETIVDPNGELLLVQAIFRHGDRTPISLYTNDPYNNYSWVEGLGQITLRGKERMYHYGQTLKERYSSYLNDILLRNVRAQSSPKRRCLETSLAVLAGLFPPENSNVWSKDVNLAKMWQPIAVETTEPERAWLLNPDTDCAAAQLIANKIPTDDVDMKRFLDEHKHFVESVTQFSGQQFPTWIQVGWLYDAIFTEKTYFGEKFEMPTWLDKVGNDTLQRLSKFNELQFSVYANWQKYIKLRTGAFLRHAIDNLKEAATLQTVSRENKKLLTFGTHDTLVSLIMHALGFFKDQPTYGSGLLFELRRDPTSKQPHVHLFYSNVTDNSNLGEFKPKITQLALNQSPRFKSLCPDAHCSLDNFENSLKDYLVEDISRECSITK